ncbi:MAG: lysine--tRNA ligase [Candidatus Eisenbacteria bacterium]|nr:lysine--tRNA ligase [Candidatus Eisenbacteria bacterium]
MGEHLRSRREKIDRIEALGGNPYPHTFRRTHLSQDILDNFQELEEKGSVRCSGRIVALREMGKASFCHITDPSGRIQIYVRRDEVGETEYEIFKQVDLGDLLGVEGVPFRTRTGEISVRAVRADILSKSLRPMPVVKEKDGVRYDAFQDREARYRYRYIDLMVNPEIREVFKTRSKILSITRRLLDEKGFMEVETPVLQYRYGGAMAQPFTTHHNALGVDLFLRIAEEIPLKKLLVGGLERVYEIGKVFRNEGIDRMHNPEFTLLEFYWAYADYHDAMDFVEEIFRRLIFEVTGGYRISWGGEVIDLETPFRKIRMVEAVREVLGADPMTESEERIRGMIKQRGKEAPGWHQRGHLIEALFDATVCSQLMQPTFVMDYPREISPLAKKVRGGDGSVVERFELFINGQEFANAFTELNDPRDQRDRLEAQMKLREQGDEEAQTLDDDFMTAMEHGMPPAAGVGIGMDRLIMLLTGSDSIRDVVLFPHLKPLDTPPDPEDRFPE